MNDLISRQAAIDAVNNAFDRETLLMGTGFVQSIIVRAIRDMPPAQQRLRFDAEPQKEPESLQMSLF